MNGLLRRNVAAGLGALVLTAPCLGCGSSSSSSSASPSKPAAGAAGATTVATADFSFTPKELHVNVGAVVSWTNHGQTTHNIQGPGFFSQALDPGKTFSHGFTKAGRYPYLCTLHPSLMQGTVVVG